MLFDCQCFFIPLGHELETNVVIANSTDHIIAGAGKNQMTIGYIPESGNETIAPGVGDNNDSVRSVFCGILKRLNWLTSIWTLLFGAGVVVDQIKLQSF